MTALLSYGVDRILRPAAHVRRASDSGWQSLNYRECCWLFLGRRSCCWSCGNLGTLGAVGHSNVAWAGYGCSRTGLSWQRRRAMQSQKVTEVVEVVVLEGDFLSASQCSKVRGSLGVAQRNTPQPGRAAEIFADTCVWPVKFARKAWLATHLKFSKTHKRDGLPC